MTVDGKLRPSSVQKQRAIAESAVQVFLRDGFDQASMDEIAQRSGVSKQTVYTHFGNKESLFVSVIAAATAEAFQRAHAPAADPENAEQLTAHLRSYGLLLMDVVLTPRLIALRRLAVSEVRRFPELARSFRAGGPSATITEMAARIRGFQDRGLLRPADADVAASTLNWLLLAAVLNDLMLGGSLSDVGPARREAVVDEAVRVFLAAHGPEGPVGERGSGAG